MMMCRSFWIPLFTAALWWCNIIHAFLSLRPPHYHHYYHHHHHPAIMIPNKAILPSTKNLVVSSSEKTTSTAPPPTTLAVASSSGDNGGSGGIAIDDDDYNTNDRGGGNIAKTTFASDSSSLRDLNKKMVDVKRDPLGHIVPRASRDAYKKAAAATTADAVEYYEQGKPRSNVDGSYSNPNRNLRILGGTARGRRLDSPPVFLRPMMGKVREAVYSTFTFFQLYEQPLCRHLDIFAGSGSVGLESLSRGAKFCTFVDLSPACCDSIVTNLQLCNFRYTTSYNNSNSNNIDGRENNSIDNHDYHYDKKKKKKNTQQQQQPVVPAAAANVLCGDAIQVLKEPDAFGIPPFVTYQIVTLCPPYEEVVYGDLLQAVATSRLVTDDTIVLIEYPIELGCLPHIYDCRGEEGGGNVMVGIRNRKYGRTVIAMYVVNPSGKLEEAFSRPEEFVSLQKNKTKKKKKK